MTNSRAKGGRGERESASKWREHGFEARRSAQTNGLLGEADIIIDGTDLWVEVKRIKSFKTLYKFMAQSIRDAAKTFRKPIVMLRADDCEWLIVLRADDFIEIYREYFSGMALNQARKELET